MAVRAVRGATQVSADERGPIMEAVGELIKEMLAVNQVAPAEVISVILTSTPDLISCHPATAARLAGLDDVPLLSATEVAVPDAMPRVVRVMAHVESDIPRGQVEHVYLRGTESLRQDTAND
ncbi:MAG: chorismate mutase [Candidatus Nanopelagicales bacterium]